MRKAVFLALAVILGLTVSFGESHANGSVKPPPDCWVRLLGTSTSDFGFGIAVDSNGNSYITGYTQGHLDGETNAGARDIFVAKYNNTSGTRQWTRLLGTVLNDSGTDIGVDSESYSYVTGFTRGDLDNTYNVKNKGEEDFFLAKYDPSGFHLWTILLGTPAIDNANSIAVDSEGNSYITGATGGNLGGDNKGGDDIFIAKYDTYGVLQWKTQLGTGRGDFAYGIAVDSNGNSYITGYTEGNLGGQTNNGSWDAFVAKYDTSGNILWTKLLGTSSLDAGWDIAADSNGNSYITGSTQGALDGQTNAGGDDIFVAKYDTSGNKLWTKLLGSSMNDFGFGIALDSNGNSYITGPTRGDLGGHLNAGSNDIFAAKYDVNGNKQWTKLLGTDSSDSGEAVGVDSRGNSYITGSTLGDLAGNPKAGASDIFLWKSGAKAMPWLLLLGD